VPHCLDLTDLSFGALQIILGSADPPPCRLDGFGKKAAMIVMLALFRAQLPLLSLQGGTFAGGIEEGELIGIAAS
jgi:hypothetical protein